MPVSFKWPFYAKTALIFISLFAFAYLMHIGSEIIIPIVYATLFAIVLSPFVNYLTRHRIPKLFAIIIVVTLTLLALMIVIYLIFSQANIFSESYPRFKIKLDQVTDQLVKWVSHEFGYSRVKVNKWIGQTTNEAISSYANGETLSRLGQLTLTLVLIPVYLFMILFYKSLLLEFIRRLFRLEHHLAVSEVLSNSKNVIQHYLVGLFFEMIIMAVLNSAALLLLGIDYAIILGILAAVLHIIPNSGGCVATTLPIFIAFVTKDSLVYPLLVFVLTIIIQFIDNNYIVPRIVASRVQINGLISVIGVLIGGAIWGLSGMFLSIPLIAILKVIFDHIESLKPWGFLLGNIVPTTTKYRFKRKMNPGLHKPSNL